MTTMFVRIGNSRTAGTDTLAIFQDLDTLHIPQRQVIEIPPHLTGGRALQIFLETETD